MSRIVYISSGHSNLKNGDKGSSGNGYIEGELTIELRSLIDDELCALGITTKLDKNSNALKETIQFFKNLVTPNCICLDLHWNSSSNPNSTGTEVFIPNSYTKLELEIAGKLTNCISNTLNIPLRGNTANTLGVKTEKLAARGQLGWMRLNGINLLIEVCFISNKLDMDKYQKNKKILAKKLAKILYEYAK